MTTEDVLSDSADLKLRLAIETAKLELLTEQLQESLDRLKAITTEDPNTGRSDSGRE